MAVAESSSTAFTLGETELTCFITGAPPRRHLRKTWKTAPSSIPYFILSKKTSGLLELCMTYVSIGATYQPSSRLQCPTSHTSTALPGITCINTKEETSCSSPAAGERHCDSAIPGALPCTGNYRRCRSSKTSCIVSPDKERKPPSCVGAALKGEKQPARLMTHSIASSSRAWHPPKKSTGKESFPSQLLLCL